MVIQTPTIIANPMPAILSISTFAPLSSFAKPRATSQPVMPLLFGVLLLNSYEGSLKVTGDMVTEYYMDYEAGVPASAPAVGPESAGGVAVTAGSDAPLTGARTVTTRDAWPIFPPASVAR
ncbi:MAG: hypothetical protein JWL75_522 [Parcubacteria group bacterium]|nr:hypothetical protein [Parcubacteria group bacterium]